MKIGQKLILAFVAITLCVGVLIGYTSITLSQKALREDIEKAPLVYNDIIIRSLDVFVYNLISDFKDLAGGYLVESSITTSNELFSKVPDVQKYMDEKEFQWTGIPKKVDEKAKVTEKKRVVDEVKEKEEFKEALKQELKEEVTRELKQELKNDPKEAAPKGAGTEQTLEAKEEKEQEKKELKAELKEELKKEVTRELKQELKQALKDEIQKETAATEVKGSEPKERIPAIVKEVMDNRLSKTLMRMAKNYEKSYEIENFGQILITNKYGANIASARKPPNYQYDNKQWWQRTKEEGVYIGEVKYDKIAGIYTLAFGFRIEDNEGKFVGAMLVKPNIKIVNRDVKEKIAETYKHVDLKLLDSEGRIIYTTVDAKLLENYGLYQEIKELKNNSGSFLAKGTRGDTKIFIYARTRSYAGFKGLGWTCVTELSAKELLGPVKMLRNTIMGISVVVILVALLVGFLVSRSISVPIMKLTVAMKEISKGNFEVALPAKTIDAKNEIGDLAKSFSRMVAALKFFKEEEENKEAGSGE